MLQGPVQRCRPGLAPRPLHTVLPQDAAELGLVLLGAAGLSSDGTLNSDGAPKALVDSEIHHGVISIYSYDAFPCHQGCLHLCAPVYGGMGQ